MQREALEAEDIRRSFVYNQLFELLSPWEAALMHVQSLLVFEKIPRSAIFCVGVQIVFW